MKIAVDQQSIFWKMASLVTVGDIQTDLAPQFSAQTRISYAVEEIWSLDYPGSISGDVSLVYHDDDPIGWLDWRALFEAPLDDAQPDSNEEPSVQAYMQPIPIGQIVGVTVPYFDLVERFAETNYRFFFVHDGKGISGMVSYSDLFKLAGVACLFTFMLEVETAALRLCQQFSTQCFAALPKKRIEAAIQILNKRFASRDYLKKRIDNWDSDDAKRYTKDLVDCTTFIDKATMINKCKLLVDFSVSKVNSVFKRAEMVRNSRAHPSGDDSLAEILPSNKVGYFLHECFLLIESMRNVTPRE